MTPETITKVKEQEKEIYIVIELITIIILWSIGWSILNSFRRRASDPSGFDCFVQKCEDYDLKLIYSEDPVTLGLGSGPVPFSNGYNSLGTGFRQYAKQGIYIYPTVVK